MDEPRKGVTIAFAGNTGLPCLLALRAKGYRLRLDYCRLDGPEVSKPSYQLDYRAECEGGRFYANSPEELLGLVAMWEVRVDNWRTKPGEGKLNDKLEAGSRIFDREGNELSE